MSVTTDTAPPSPATATSQEALNALLCDLLPPQGAWSDEAYLWLTDSSNRLIEFTDGCIEELPIPTFTHQSILLFLYNLLHAYLKPRGGVVMVGRVTPARTPRQVPRARRVAAARPYRPPLFRTASGRAPTWRLRWVSPDNPDRDLVEKRADYAEAGIPEYWIADPRDETVRVLSLRGAAYVEHGVYRRGDTATSALLAGSPPK